MISRATAGAAALVLSLLAASAAVAAPGPIEPVQVQRGEALFSPTVGVGPKGSGEIVFREFPGPSMPDRLGAIERGSDGSFGPLEQLTRTHNAESPPSFLFDGSDNLFAAWGIATSGVEPEWARRPAGGIFGAAGELRYCGRFLAYAQLPDGTIAVACSSSFFGTPPNDDEVRFGEIGPGEEFFAANGDLSGPVNDNFLQPQIAVGADGTLAVAWYQQDETTGKNKVQVSVRPAGAANFEPVKTLVEATSPDPDSLSDVTVLPDGTVMALVSREPGLELYTRPPGTSTSWSGAQTLFSDYASGLLAVGPGGAVTAAITDMPSGLSGPRQISVATRAPGGSFGPFTPIASGGVFARNLEVGPDGTAFLAWGDYGAPKASLLGALAPPGGAFGPPITIAAGVNSFSTALAPGGNVLAAWGEEVAPKDMRMMVGGIDSGAAPTFGSVEVPATVLAGSPVTLSASASDWAGLREIRWDLPGGTVLTGATVSHTFSTPGNATVRVTAVDRGGNSATSTREIRVVGEAGPPLDRAKPKLTLKVRGKLKLATFLRGIAATVGIGEPSQVEVELLARARSAHVFAAQNLILASRQLKNATGNRTVRLRPNRKLLGGAKHFRVLLRVSAVDAAGSESVQQRTIRVG